MAEYNSVNLGRIMPKYTGDYSTNVNYNTLDIVFYEGNSYIATQPSLRQTPAIDSEYWGLVSGKGDKGDKGDTGAQGPKGDKGDTPDITVGGRNLYLNSRVLSDAYGTNNNARVTVEPLDSTTNMWHIVSAQGNGGVVGIYLSNYGNGKIPNISDWSYSADVKGTGKASVFGIEGTSTTPVKGIVGNDWSRISQTGHISNPQSKTIIMYFDTRNSPLDVYIKLPKLEIGNVATDWTPAPEDVPSNDAQLVHKTGNETVAGDKTFTGTIYANNRIQGSLATRMANFTDLATVAADMFSYQGLWWFGGNGTLLNSPVSSYILVEVFHGSIRGNGYIRVTSANSGDSYYTTVNSGGLSTWNKYAKDATVVHNTGNEVIAGDKTFTGNTTLATTTILAGNYGLRVTPSGFQKTTDGKTWVSANI